MFLAQVSVFEIAIFTAIVVVFIAVFAFLLVHLRLWFQAFMCRVPISLFEIIKLRLRRVNPTPVVAALIMARQAGITLSRTDVERAYSQGVDPLGVAHCLIGAHRAGITLSPAEVERAYLQGVDALEIVRILVFAPVAKHDVTTSADAPRSPTSEETEQRRLERLRDLKEDMPEITFQQLVDAYLKDEPEDKGKD